MNNNHTARPSLKQAAAILRGEEDAMLTGRLEATPVPRPESASTPQMVAAAKPHGIVRIDGGSGMNAKSAAKLIAAVGPSLAKIPSYAKIRGLET